MVEQNKEEENLSQEVDELLEQGLSQKEVEANGYSPTLVRQRVRKRVKNGKGPPVSTGRNGSVALRKTGESVLPEWLESDVAEIFDGHKRDQRIFLAGMSVPLMGLRLFAEGVKPIIELMGTWQKGQLEAAQAAQFTATEAAEAAAAGAAARATMHIDQKFDQMMHQKADIAMAPDPMKGLMARTMETMMNRITGMMFGGQGGQGGQVGPTPGLVDKRSQGGK